MTCRQLTYRIEPPMLLDPHVVQSMLASVNLMPHQTRLSVDMHGDLNVLYRFCNITW